MLCKRFDLSSLYKYLLCVPTKVLYMELDFVFNLD